MLKYALLSSLLVASSFAADPIPPAPPACLSGPVTLGSVTLTCTAIDNTAYGAASDSGNGGYLFQVRVTSTDLDTIGVRVGVAWSLTFDPKQPAQITTRWAFAPKIGGAFAFTFTLPTAWDQNLQAVPYGITSIQVQELKASSSQSF